MHLWPWRIEKSDKREEKANPQSLKVLTETISLSHATVEQFFQKGFKEA